jgi:uncharacterized protein (DUF1697 family)
MVVGDGPGSRFPSNPSPSATVAFLRGINVGGHHKIPMPALKKAFEAMGFKNVRTILASGNVVFEPAGKKDEDLEATIVRGLAGAFGFPVPVLLRSIREIAALVAVDPFKGLAPSPDTKLYVTFLPRYRPGSFGARLPAPPKCVRIVSVRPGEVFSSVTLSPRTGTPELMAFLEKSLGRDVTNRNWQTVLRLIE